MNKLCEKFKKRNLFESVLDNIEEKSKYSTKQLRYHHRQVISMKRRMQYYKRLKKDIYDKVAPEDIQTTESANDCKKVWFCWLQGIENAPNIVKACYKSAEENLCKPFGYELVLITENNFEDYIELPEYIMEKYHKHIISPALFSDLIRLELLCKYGGIWSDSTVFYTGNRIMNGVLDAELFLPSKWIFFNGEIMQYDVWLIRSKANNIVLRTVRQCLHKYWEKYNFQLDYFIFHLFLTMAMNDHREFAETMPFLSVHCCEYMQMKYAKKVESRVLDSILTATDIHKLNYKNAPKNELEGSVYDWILNRY